MMGIELDLEGGISLESIVDDPTGITNRIGIHCKKNNGSNGQIY
jgi:hypothetical protein